jgi:hypothetical protein
MSRSEAYDVTGLFPKSRGELSGQKEDSFSLSSVHVSLCVLPEEVMADGQ